MPLYNCKAKKGPGEVIQEMIEANSSDEAVAKLSQRGYYPLRVEPVQITESRKVTTPTKTFLTRVRVRDLNTFTRQLASLIKSGVPLLRALNIIKEQTESHTLKNIISDLIQEVREGRMLSEAMNKYPNIFPPLYIALIKSGEDSGTLEQVLIRTAEHREHVEEIKSRIRAALVYPIFVLCIGALTIFAMITFVIPQIKGVFETIDQPLPLSTEILIGTSDFIAEYWLFLATGLVILLILGKGIILIQKYALDEFKLHLPILGKFTRKSEITTFSRTLGLLLRNGIPILAALEISITTLSNEVMKKEFNKIYEGLKGGNSLGFGLKQSRLFPPFMVNLVAVGEESGRLDETLVEIANTYERETEETIKISLSLFEPILILVMGVVVGFIVISMLLPIFSIGAMVK